MKEIPAFISSEYYSNCLIETLKAKIKNPQITIYSCKPRITESGCFQMMHVMWADCVADYDFADNQPNELPWYKCFWYRGRIRQFPSGFAERYSTQRNRKLRQFLKTK